MVPKRQLILLLKECHANQEYNYWLIIITDLCTYDYYDEWPGNRDHSNHSDRDWSRGLARLLLGPDVPTAAQLSAGAMSTYGRHLNNPVHNSNYIQLGGVVGYAGGCPDCLFEIGTMVAISVKNQSGGLEHLTPQRHFLFKVVDILTGLSDWIAPAAQAIVDSTPWMAPAAQAIVDSPPPTPTPPPPGISQTSGALMYVADTIAVSLASSHGIIDIVQNYKSGTYFRSQESTFSDALNKLTATVNAATSLNFGFLFDMNDLLGSQDGGWYAIYHSNSGVSAASGFKAVPVDKKNVDWYAIAAAVITHVVYRQVLLVVKDGDAFPENALEEMTSNDIRYIVGGTIKRVFQALTLMNSAKNITPDSLMRGLSTTHSMVINPKPDFLQTVNALISTIFGSKSKYLHQGEDGYMVVEPTKVESGSGLDSTSNNPITTTKVPESIIVPASCIWAEYGPLPNYPEDEKDIFELIAQVIRCVYASNVIYNYQPRGGASPLSVLTRIDPLLLLYLRTFVTGNNTVNKRLVGHLIGASLASTVNYPSQVAFAGYVTMEMKEKASSLLGKQNPGLNSLEQYRTMYLDFVEQMNSWYITSYTPDMLLGAKLVLSQQSTIGAATTGVGAAAGAGAAVAGTGAGAAAGTGAGAAASGAATTGESNGGETTAASKVASDANKILAAIASLGPEAMYTVGHTVIEDFIEDDTNAAAMSAVMEKVYGQDSPSSAQTNLSLRLAISLLQPVYQQGDARDGDVVLTNQWNDIITEAAAGEVVVNPASQTFRGLIGMWTASRDYFKDKSFSPEVYPGLFGSMFARAYLDSMTGFESLQAATATPVTSVNDKPPPGYLDLVNRMQDEIDKLKAQAVNVHACTPSAHTSLPTDESSSGTQHQASHDTSNAGSHANTGDATDAYLLSTIPASRIEGKYRLYISDDASEAFGKIYDEAFANETKELVIWRRGTEAYISTYQAVTNPTQTSSTSYRFDSHYHIELNHGETLTSATSVSYQHKGAKYHHDLSFTKEQN